GSYKGSPAAPSAGRATATRAPLEQRLVQDRLDGFVQLLDLCPWVAGLKHERLEPLGDGRVELGHPRVLREAGGLADLADPTQSCLIVGVVSDLGVGPHVEARSRGCGVRLREAVLLAAEPEDPPKRLIGVLAGLVHAQRVVADEG